MNNLWKSDQRAVHPTSSPNCKNNKVLNLACKTMKYTNRFKKHNKYKRILIPIKMNNKDRLFETDLVQKCK